MSGMAWELSYRDGSRARLIESPKPKGPMSAAVFLHEIGHHAIGFSRYKPRCLEEYHAWAWALEAMHRLGLHISDGVQHRVHESLWYALAKAGRRGMRGVPAELLPFGQRPKRGTPSRAMREWLARLDANAIAPAATTTAVGAGVPTIGVGPTIAGESPRRAEREHAS